ncbi:hypothetical protein ABVT39_000052 [Epinephelus coioides]
MIRRRRLQQSELIGALPPVCGSLIADSPHLCRLHLHAAWERERKSEGEREGEKRLHYTAPEVLGTTLLALDVQVRR